MCYTKRALSEQAFRSAINEDHRPWGKFREFPISDVSSVKIITVNPGAQLSLQYHNHRSEFWIALDEGLEIEIDGNCIRPEPNQEIFIPQGAKHRLKGIGDKPGRIMELWLGESGEDDIVRLEDSYGRN